MTSFQNKRKYQNTRKKEAKPVQSRSTQRWRTKAPQIMLSMTLIVGVVFGSMALNQKLSVTYWDIQADEQLQAQIEVFFEQQQHMDFWHTRASVIQANLLRAIPDMKDVEVSRILPDGLQVIAQARQPLALWETQGLNDVKTIMLIDQQAQAYRSLRVSEEVDLPLFRVPSRHLKKASLAMQWLAKEHVEKSIHLSELIVEHQRWRFNFSSGEQWRLHHANLKQDMGKIMAILAKPRWKQGYWRMDARIPQRWFIRPARQEVI